MTTNECLLVVRISRRKREAHEDDIPGLNDLPDDDGNAELSHGPRVSDEFITSTDDIPAPPDNPLHQDATWPTESGITEENATALCDGAIRATTLYSLCLSYTILDRTAYVNSCVADIQVISS